MSKNNSGTHDPWEEPARETSYEAHQRLKRQKQRARQLKANDANRTTTQPHTRSGSSEDRNISNPHLRPHSPRQSSQRSLPAAFPDENHGDNDIPSRSYGARARMPEMYASEMEEVYDSGDPTAPPSRATTPPPRATTRVAPTRIGPTTTRNPQPSRTRERELEWEQMERRPRRPRPTTETPRRARPRNRGFGSTMLIGCIGGLITIGLIATILIVTFLRTPLGGNLLTGITSKTYTQSHTQSLQVSNLTLVQIQNHVGNVNVTVSSSVSTPTLTTLKKVTASSVNAANSEFARILVTVQQPVSSDVTINATLPNSGNSSGDSVDLILTLPPAFGATASASITFNITTISGNLNVQQVELAASSCLKVQQGNVTFNGTLDTRNGTALVPCSNTSDNNPHPWYTFQTEVGSLDVTLPAATPVTLIAATNAGSINGAAFGLTIPNSDNSASYDGPLTGGSSTPVAQLKLDVGTGNILLHQ